MRLSENLALGCLVLSFALLFGGCSYLPNSGTESSKNDAKSKEETLKVLNERKNVISKNIETLDSESEKAGKRQKQLAKKILDLKDENFEESTLIDVDVKCGEVEKQTENPPGDKPKPSADKPKPPECREYISNKNQIGLKSGELNKARNELKKVTDEIDKVEKSESGNQDSGGGFGGLLPWLLFGFTGIGGLGLLGGLYFLLNHKIGREREAATSGFNAVRSEQKEIKSQIKQLNDTVKLQNDRIERQQSTIQSFQKRSSEASNIGYAAQPQQLYEQPPVYKPEPQFPVSAEDYLNKVRHNGQKASADLIGGLLVQDPNKNEEFLIVRDNALADGVFYAVPSFNRFSTRNDYLTYYQNYYACENPSGGTVWILAPTTVRRVDGGWKLEDMGELEIR